VPQIVSLSLDEASQALREANLQVGDTTPVPSKDPQGTVRRVEPGEGETVPEGSTVDIRYASGQNRVPDVTGLSGDQAAAEIEDAGFTPSARSEQTDQADPGTVVSQSPGAGEARRLGTTVTYTVAEAPPTPTETETETPTPTPTPTDTSSPSITVAP
jgi:serine/threonine-protein kinase